MKKLFSFLLIMASLLFMVSQSTAQIVTTKTGVSTASVAKTTLTNTDTGYVNFEVDATTKSITAWDVKTSGTVAGTIYLSATVEGTTWDRIDSLTRANSNNHKVFTIPSPNIYAKYRLEWIQSGTSVSTFKGYLLKRTGQWTP